MAKTIKISKHGLTRCPGCARHVYVEPNWRETVCPFCNSGLIEAPAPPSRGVRRAGRLAAGLVAAALTGCPTPQPVYGAPPPADAQPTDVAPVVDVAPETALDAAYGGPPSRERD